jgi:hypothetical protein
MAQAAGVDLAAEMRAGNLTQEGWSDAVARCRGCSWERDGGCSRWLARRDHVEAEKIPERCVNKGLFRDLKA